VMRSLVSGLVVASSFAMLACSPAVKTGSVDAARLTAADADSAAWMTVGRTYSEQRYSPLAAITPATIDKLGLAWSAEFDTDRGQEATPLIVDGVLYTTTAWSKVFAFDAKSGKPLWSPKNGFFYVLDRATGSLISAKNYVAVNWASGIGADGHPIENPVTRYEKAPALISPGPRAATTGIRWPSTPARDWSTSPGWRCRSFSVRTAPSAILKAAGIPPSAFS